MSELTVDLTPLGKPTSCGIMTLFVVFLAFAWGILISHLQIVWSSDDQYRYGWAVPLLCAALMIRKTPGFESGGRPIFQHYFGVLFGLGALALCYAPTRLVQAANPDWRVVSWALALEVVGLTLLLVYLILGGAWLRRLAFPIAFFLVAVPWPTFLENSLIQGLTRADAATAVELLDWLGISALQHGNIIEVATGNVGVDDACSGIRSLQATLMISLFLGESYQLNVLRRIGLLLGGLALSFFFNVARMSLLTWVAARDGLAAIKQWHDPAGNTILVACCLALWGLGVLLARQQKSVPVHSVSTAPIVVVPPRRPLMPVLMALLTWFAAVEISVESWYRWHEQRLPPVKPWIMTWPTNNPTFQTLTLSEQALGMLNYDSGQSVAWKADDLAWQAIYLQWNPMRRALVYAKMHTPDVCITAAGHPTTLLPDRAWVEAGGFQLPFAVYSVANTPQPMHVFYCMWSDRMIATDRKKMPRTFADRWEPVQAGVRTAGHRSLEIALAGNLDEQQAEAALQKELQKIIHAE